MASNAVSIKAGMLIHIGKIWLLKVISQPKTNRRRCIKERIENIIAAIIVNGFIFHCLFSVLFLSKVYHRAILHSTIFEPDFFLTYLTRRGKVFQSQLSQKLKIKSGTFDSPLSFMFCFSLCFHYHSANPYIITLLFLHFMSVTETLTLLILLFLSMLINRKALTASISKISS